MLPWPYLILTGILSHKSQQLRSGAARPGNLEQARKCYGRALGMVFMGLVPRVIDAQRSI
jgi:hypothetical protein